MTITREPENHTQSPRFKGQDGFIALITIIVLSAILVTIGLTISLGSLTELVASSGASQSSQALQVADACAEEAYYRLKKDNTYAGGSLTIDNVTCTISISGSGSTRTVNTVAAVGNYTRRVQAGVSFVTNTAGSANRATLTSWQEL